MNIVVIESGFVYIGMARKVDHELLGSCIVLDDASNIRRWGTDKGLGQLAYEGKQPNTVLDYTGTVTIPTAKILHFISVSEKAAQTYV